ncbi:hypothetical protein ABG067_003361 [Albugo candida]
MKPDCIPARDILCRENDHDGDKLTTPFEAMMTPLQHAYHGKTDQVNPESCGIASFHDPKSRLSDIRSSTLRPKEIGSFDANKGIHIDTCVPVRQSNMALELLARAIELYRKRTISGKELGRLNRLVLQLSSVLEMCLVTSAVESISAYEWNLLVTQSKGYRPALALRIVDEYCRRTRWTKTTQISYVLRVADVQTGVVWFTKKTQKDIYRLWKELRNSSDFVRGPNFPTQGRFIRKTKDGMDQRTWVEKFLRTITALVAQPLTSTIGSYYWKIQSFLQVPSTNVLSLNRSQPFSRQLRVYVHHILHDFMTHEGKACDRYLERFDNQFSEKDNVMNWLDSLGNMLDEMQDYMLECRFEELMHYARHLLAFPFASEDGKWRGNEGFQERQRRDNVMNERLQKCITDAVRYEIEERLCTPVLDALKASLESRLGYKERELQARIETLRGMPQTFYGISVDKIAICSWLPVIQTMKEMDDAFLVWDKMRKLLATAHHIHSLYKLERHLFETEFQSYTQSDLIDVPNAINTLCEVAATESNVLSGDDLLAIFTYILVQSELRTPIMSSILLNHLCDPDKRKTEASYYVATFEAAIQHIFSISDSQ